MTRGAAAYYYDTDNIQEAQKETLRICRECSGALKIESNSSRGYKVLAIHVPRKACDACQEPGVCLV